MTRLYADSFRSEALLLGRLWWHDRTTKKYLSEDAYDSVPWQVMKTIVQSQAAYSAGVVFNLATYAARSNLVLVTNAILPPLIVCGLLRT